MEKYVAAGFMVSPWKAPVSTNTDELLSVARPVTMPREIPMVTIPTLLTYGSPATIYGRPATPVSSKREYRLDGRTFVMAKKLIK
jgi:hypothetical protein